MESEAVAAQGGIIMKTRTAAPLACRSLHGRLTLAALTIGCDAPSALEEAQTDIVGADDGIAAVVERVPPA